MDDVKYAVSTMVMRSIRGVSIGTSGSMIFLDGIYNQPWMLIVSGVGFVIFGFMNAAVT